MTDDRPINLQEEAARSVYKGRKTEVRLPIKPQPRLLTDVDWTECPLDHRYLWVREKWAVGDEYDDLLPRDLPVGTHVYYSVSPPVNEPLRGKWRQSTHMPRWASRSCLSVKDIWLEKLHDIEKDTIYREGGISTIKTGSIYREGAIGLKDFLARWDLQYATTAYWAKANPWVWCARFSREGIGAIGETLTFG